MFQDILQKTFFHNRILDYLICLSTFIIGIVIIRIFKAIVLHRLKEWAKKTAATIDDFLIRIFETTLAPLLYFGIFYLSVKYLTLNQVLSKAIDVLGVVLLTIFGIRFLISIIRYGLETYWIKKEGDTTREKSLKGLLTIIKVVVWGVGITFLLDNLGFKISTVIAGLGI